MQGSARMKAILINAKEQTVTEVELNDPDSYGELQELVGGYICCGWTWYDVAGFPRNILYVDDEGMLKGYDHYFRILNADKVGFCNPSGPTFLYGNGVILGVTMEGESTDTSIVAEDLEVSWGDHAEGRERVERLVTSLEKIKGTENGTN
jgi:hypothetical protein